MTDRSAKAAMPIASRNGCLWGAKFQGTPGAYRGGCNFSAGAAYDFTYKRDAAKSILTLLYSSKSAATTVTMTFGPIWFEAQLAFANHMGATLQSVLFPSDLVLTASSVEAAYVPYYLPGARLKNGFFTSHRNLSVMYPGARAFADYLALDYAGGRVAWYSVNPGGRIAPAQLGFRDDEQTKAGTCYALHVFQAWTGDGETFSTPVVRFQLGATPAESIATYRAANGIAEYPSLQEKLGDRMAAIAASPLVKMMDLRTAHRTFTEMISHLGVVRAPAILHPVAYWPVGFDRNCSSRDFSTATRSATGNRTQPISGGIRGSRARARPAGDAVHESHMVGRSVADGQKRA